MTTPHFDNAYEQGPTAPYVDWVAGGNFDGYIIKKSMTFYESNNQVAVQWTVLDQSRYDGSAANTELFGTFEYTGKDTITVKYGALELRGKILGDQKEYIVFSVFCPVERIGQTEVYALKKTHAQL